MKTRNLLVAFALPTLFAACTAEEIVNQADNNVLETRALLGDLSVKIENPVASRVSWSDETLKWGDLEEDDVFSSAVVDATRGWGGVADNLLTNYIWKKNAAGEWGTTSQMVEGIYSFYSYKGIATKNDRDAVKFDLTAQTADLNDPTKVINDNQLFFSPLYNIEAKNTTAENTIPLDLTFYPYHSIAAFKMTNTTGQTLLISQIITEGEFAAKGAILPSKIKAAKLMWNVRKDESVYKLDPKTPATTTAAAVEYTANEIKEMWQESDLDNIKPVSGTAASGETETMSEVLAMNCGNYEWEDGEELIAYMVMPANAEIEAVKINVVDEEGEAKYVEVVERASIYDQDSEVEGKQLQISSTGLKDIVFKRSVPVSVFGYTSAGAPKTINVKEANLISNNGYYIDNKEDLEKLVNISRGNIKVYNFGELIIDAEVAEIIAEYTGGVVTFNNPIEIKDTEEVKISNINFGVVTVKGEDEKTGFEGTTVVFEEANVTGQLTIEAGATVTIEEGEYADVVNNGTLSIGEGVAESKFENNGVMNVCDYNRVGHDITLKKGTLNYVGYDADEDGTVEPASEKYEAVLPAIEATDTYAINYAAGVNLVVDAADDITPATGKTASLTVNGEFELNAALTIAKGATLTAAEEITGEGSLVINGTATGASTKEIEVSVTVNEGATLNNNGIANNIVLNDGLIVTGAGSKTAVAGNTAGKVGRIDNTNEAQVSYNGNQTVYYTVNNKAVEDLEGILFKRYSVNTLRVTGTLTMDRPFGKDADWDQLKVLETLELAAGAELKVDGDVHVSFENVVVEGDAKIYGWSKAESFLRFDKDVTVELKNKNVLTTSYVEGTTKGYKLTIADVSVGVADNALNAEGHNGGNGTGVVTFVESEDEAPANYTAVPYQEIVLDDAILNATRGTTAYVSVEAGLTNAINSAATVSEIILTDEINLTSDLNIGRAIAIKGGKLVGKIIKTNGNVAFEGVELNPNVAYVAGAGDGNYGVQILTGNATFKDCVIKNKAYSLKVEVSAGNVTFDNCNIVEKGTSYLNQPTGKIEMKNCVVTGGTKGMSFSLGTPSDITKFIFENNSFDRGIAMTASGTKFEELSEGIKKFCTEFLEDNTVKGEHSISINGGSEDGGFFVD